MQSGIHMWSAVFVDTVKINSISGLLIGFYICKYNTILFLQFLNLTLDDMTFQAQFRDKNMAVVYITVALILIE